MNKKALLVGSSFSAVPIFFELKKRGFDVGVCGNAPTDPCHQYADQSYYIDYSKPEELLKIVEQESFDYLVPTCNDYSYMSCVDVASKKGFPGFDNIATSVVLHNKDRFREFMTNNRLASPKAVNISGSNDIDVSDMSFPLIVKPVDSFSGRGVNKVLNENQLEQALNAASDNSRTSKIVVEEFIEGTLHSHSAFLNNKSICTDFFVDEYCTVYPYQVNCSNHPSVISAALQQDIRDEIEKMARALELADGLLHTQLLVKGDQFWVVECMRRCPGDLYGQLVTRSTGINYTELFVKAFIGEALSYQEGSIEIKNIGRHTISTNKAVVVSGFVCDIPSQKTHITPLKGSGEKLGVAPYDKLAIVFSEFNSRQEMFDYSPRLETLVSIESIGCIQ